MTSLSLLMSVSVCKVYQATWGIMCVTWLYLCTRPLDTIGSLSNRWSYGFAFGAVSSSVLLLFSERYIPFTVPPWARGTLSVYNDIQTLRLHIFTIQLQCERTCWCGVCWLFSSAIVYLVGALEVGLVYFPFFACLSTPFRKAGAVLGILYSLAW